MLFYRQIWQHYQNVKPFFIPKGEEEIETRFREFFTSQDQWIRVMIAKYGTSDIYWRHVSYVLSQFDGLYAGYKATAESGWVSDGKTVKSVIIIIVIIIIIKLKICCAS